MVEVSGRERTGKDGMDVVTGVDGVTDMAGITGIDDVTGVGAMTGVDGGNGVGGVTGMHIPCQLDAGMFVGHNVPGRKPGYADYGKGTCFAEDTLAAYQ